MEKRVVFQIVAWLPWVLLAPQMAVICVFFFWPAARRCCSRAAAGRLRHLQRVRRPGELPALFNDPSYLESFKTTAVFSMLVAFFGLALSLLLAVMANRVVRGVPFYKTLLIWPYAVAPAVAGVLWLFMFSPSAWRRLLLQRDGLPWNHLLNPNHAMALIVMAAVWKQISYNFLFFLAGLQSIPQVADRGGGHRRRRPWKRFWTIQFPLLSPTTFFLLVINVVYAFFDTFAIVDAATHGGPGQGDGDPGLQGLLRRLQGPGPGRLGRAVGGADGDRGGADRDPVPLRREEGAVLLMVERDNRPWPSTSSRT
jgi:sn-glycerol 3-phosphate transport system permease protein